jgi:hypothetical protein
MIARNSPDKNLILDPFDIKIKPFEADINPQIQSSPFKLTSKNGPSDMIESQVPSFGSNQKTQSPDKASRLSEESPEKQFAPLEQERARLMTFSEAPLADSIDNIAIFDTSDILIIQKKYNSLQMAFRCERENRFAFMPYDTQNKSFKNPIYEAIETNDSSSKYMCTTADCREVYLAIHKFSNKGVLSEKFLFTVIKAKSLDCCYLCDQTFIINAVMNDKAVEIGTIIKTNCSIYDRYEVFDHNKKLVFIFKGSGRNMCVCLLCNCQKLRKMNYIVWAPNQTILTSIEHKEDSFTLMFPPKVTKLQRVLFAFSSLIILQNKL